MRKQAAKIEYEWMLLPDCQSPLQVGPEMCFEFPLSWGHPLRSTTYLWNTRDNSSWA